jgi:6-phosphogluconolactonase/glucosamine-6-phosphate isomerase/deaminase|tara:strand:+ start:495 stop:656 length:162 start_codon:yes stop_codon:yes gene_type:complete
MLAKALAGPVTMELPASVIQLAASATVFLDEASASGLDLQALNRRPGWRVESE